MEEQLWQKLVPTATLSPTLNWGALPDPSELRHASALMPWLLPQRNGQVHENVQPSRVGRSATYKQDKL